VVGAGFIGRVHINAVRAAGGVVVGVADPDPGRAAAMQAMAMAERAAGPVDELIETPDVEVVHICTSNESHFNLAQRALRAGKHVVCRQFMASIPDDYLDAARVDGLGDFRIFWHIIVPMSRTVEGMTMQGIKG
jgi:threonine dehydrogenase-like Zn-dependent dehydrogenase